MCLTAYACLRDRNFDSKFCKAVTNFKKITALSFVRINLSAAAMTVEDLVQLMSDYLLPIESKGMSNVFYTFYVFTLPSNSFLTQVEIWTRSWQKEIKPAAVAQRMSDGPMSRKDWVC